MGQLNIPTLLIIAAALTILAGFVLSLSANSERETLFGITNFEECAAAGYPVMESYPEQCRTPDGRLFVRDISNDPYAPGDGMTFNGCAVAGCSSQLCVSADEAEGIVTTCEYRAEYACYQEASCEPQADGKCGWTQTPELQRCLASPPEFEEGTGSLQVY